MQATSTSGVDESSAAAGAGPPPDSMLRQPGDPVERQRQREEKWKQRLSKQTTSWWDSASLAIQEGAQRADDKIHGASKAIARTNGSLRTLARGRNHAKAECAKVDAWRDEAVANFLGGEAGPSGTTAEDNEPLPEVDEHYSPGHFDRRYKAQQRKKLPPLRRSTLMRAAAAAHEREAQNLANRARVFVSGA